MSIRKSKSMKEDEDRLLECNKEKALKHGVLMVKKYRKKPKK